MSFTPEWVSAGCAVVSIIVSIVAIVKTGAASTQINNLKSQVSTLTTQLNSVSSSMKDSKIKQVNKKGSDNQFIGGNYNE